jgi:hypothetical protein
MTRYAVIFFRVVEQRNRAASILRPQVEVLACPSNSQVPHAWLFSTREGAEKFVVQHSDKGTGVIFEEMT